MPMRFFDVRLGARKPPKNDSPRSEPRLDTLVPRSSVAITNTTQDTMRKMRDASDVNSSLSYNIGGHRLPTSPLQQAMAQAREIDMEDADSLMVKDRQYRALRAMAPSPPQTTPASKGIDMEEDEIHTDSAIDICSHSSSSSLGQQENDAPSLDFSPPQAMDVRRDSAINVRSKSEHKDAGIPQSNTHKSLVQALQRKSQEQKVETKTAKNPPGIIDLTKSSLPSASSPPQCDNTGKTQCCKRKFSTVTLPSSIGPRFISRSQDANIGKGNTQESKSAPRQTVKRTINLPSISSILPNVENKLTVSGAEGVPVQAIDLALAHATKLQANPHYKPEDEILFLNNEDHNSDYIEIPNGCDGLGEDTKRYPQDYYSDKPSLRSQDNKDTSHYIENPNNGRDGARIDTRRYPQDYYSDEPVPEPYDSENQRAVYAKASEERERDDLDVIHRKYPKVDSPNLEWSDLRQFPALEYTFRSGAFTGKSLDAVPEWYREELMCGGEHWLVKTDVALGIEMKRRKYGFWKVEDSTVKSTTDVPFPVKTDHVHFLTSASATLPAVTPAQPTQTTNPVSRNRHGKVTLPPLPACKKTRLPSAHAAFWRQQRNYARPPQEQHIDSDTINLARKGPAAKFTDSAGGVNRNRDRDVLDTMWAAKWMGGWYEKSEVNEWLRKESEREKD